MSVPYYQTAFAPAEFALRRAEVLRRIDDACAVLAGAPASGAFDLPRQSNEFFYLTGVEVPHAYLLIDAVRKQSTLYLPHHDAKHAKSEGEQLHCDDPETVSRITGIERVAPLSQLARDVAEAKCVYTPHEPAEGRQACRDVLRYAAKQRSADPYIEHASREEQFVVRLKTIAPRADIQDLSPHLDTMRLIKSDAELAVMRRAGQLTAEAVVLAMQATRSGMYEYQLGAIADYRYLSSGASGSGYRPIVACGKNIWNAHYFRNNCELADGELVLMDYAAEIANYTSDIGRMWPVSGKYSPVQRELYGFVVEYHKVLLATIRAGHTVDELVSESLEKMLPTWETWPFSKDAYRTAARKMIESPVAFTHPVGMAVHDVGEYKSQPLRSGFVFALDPQLWVPEEELYIRVEDTVAVTPSGVENLTAGAPLDLDEVERICLNVRKTG